MPVFRWNDWNLEHTTNHGVSVSEIEAIIRAAKNPYPEARGDEKYRVVGQGIGGRFIQVIYILDDDGSIYVSIMKKKTSAIDEFLSLSDRDKESAAAEFDKEFIGDSFGPLNVRQRNAWARAKHRMNRTAEGNARRVSVALPRELLDKSDSYAKKLGVTRSELVKRGLRAVLSGKA